MDELKLRAEQLRMECLRLASVSVSPHDIDGLLKAAERLYKFATEGNSGGTHPLKQVA